MNPNIRSIKDLQEEKGKGNNTKSNPIINRISSLDISAPKKSSNKIYGGYNQTKNRFYSGATSSNIDFLDLFSEFSFNAQKKDSIEKLFFYLHNVISAKLGYSFSALGLLNNDLSCLNIKLIDKTSNSYTSKIYVKDEQNPAIKCLKEKHIIEVDNMDFLKTNYIKDTSAMVIPMIVQGDCIGVFVGGYSVTNHNNNQILKLLIDHGSLLISNMRMKEKLNLDEDTDTLTGLSNHKAFQESLRKEVVKSKETNKSLSVMLIDINNITQINRDFGHSKGDEVIKLVANKVSKNIRNNDLAGRYGGDELAVIMPDIDGNEAVYIAEYLNYSISCCSIDEVGPVSVSIGIATYPQCAETQEKLLVIAEQSMYISKNKLMQEGKSPIVSASDIDFWSENALNSFAAVMTKRHSQWGMEFEEELVDKFHKDSLNNNHLLDIVTSLAGAIDAKDSYTKGHSSSVSRYSEALAKTLSLPEGEIERIKLGAILHDVGKIGIPESILKKPTQLDNQEWEIMKQHPVIGVNKVLAPISSLKDLLPMVKHHHENWDGSGYPDNLKGEDIPIGARIVAIADAFHALVSDRPYRKGLSLDKAIDILKLGAGKQWDKNLVRKFIIIAPSLMTKV